MEYAAAPADALCGVDDTDALPQWLSAATVADELRWRWPCWTLHWCSAVVPVQCCTAAVCCPGSWLEGSWRSLSCQDAGWALLHRVWLVMRCDEASALVIRVPATAGCMEDGGVACLACDEDALDSRRCGGAHAQEAARGLHSAFHRALWPRGGCVDTAALRTGGCTLIHTVLRACGAFDSVLQHAQKRREKLWHSA